MNKYLLSLAALLIAVIAVHAKKPLTVEPSYAWEARAPLGIRYHATIDTLLHNYYLTAVPQDYSPAVALTGNLGGATMNMVYMDREPQSDFFPQDALRHWLPSPDSHKFYNTRIPMTLVSYLTGGGQQTSADRLTGVFSGNAGPRWQVGANIDFIYSKGSYNYQAAKSLVWGLSTSYMGDRYELQAFFNHHNVVNKENGGITDDLYIIDPAQLQGGVSTIEPKSIPTYLSAAHNRVKGSDLMINNRYKVGFWDETRDENDSVIARTYVPVTSFIWTLQYNDGKHKFINTSASEDQSYWPNHYQGLTGTNESGSYSKLSNTLGVALLEGFNRWAKAGITLYGRHTLLRYHQMPDTMPLTVADGRPEDLTPWPFDYRLPEKYSDNNIHVGGRLTKQKGAILTYDAGVEFGLLGRCLGDVVVDGNISTRFPLLRDTVTITAYGDFKNQAPPYLTEVYQSNHYVWHNDFSKIRTYRVGGSLDFPFTRTRIDISIENIQNHIYFGPEGTPVQYGGNVQIFSARLEQNFKLGILHLDNRAVFQTSTREEVIPLPKFAIYSNLYLLFRVARVLHVQMGVDCDYYTAYYAPEYQPATMTFRNQREIKCGNYPFMNVYANFKLSKARFFVLYSHFNRGLIGGNNYFSMPHYPMNPSQFRVGVSVDFAN